MKIDLDYVNSKLPNTFGPIQLDNITKLNFRIKNDGNYTIDENDIEIFYSWNNPILEQRGQTHIVRVKNGEPTEAYVMDYKSLQKVFKKDLTKIINTTDFLNELKIQPASDCFLINNVLYKNYYSSYNLLTNKDDDYYFYPHFKKTSILGVLDKKWYSDRTLSDVLRYDAETKKLNKVYILETYENYESGLLLKFPGLKQFTPCLVWYYFDENDNYTEPTEFLIDVFDLDVANKYIKKIFGVDELPLLKYRSLTRENTGLIFLMSVMYGETYKKSFTGKERKLIAEDFRKFNRIGYL